MKKLWTILSVLAIANLLAMLGFVGYLKATDRLSMDRMRELREKFTATVTQDNAKKAQAEADKMIRSHGATSAFKGYHGFPACACISVEEVVFIAKNPQMSADMLKLIADRSEWFGRSAVAEALARNPKTPAELAVRALQHCSQEAVRQMAKGVGAPPHVVQAARKGVLKGG